MQGEISELAKALSNFQGSMTPVKKDAINPFYKSKYATLDTIWDTIRKPLSENGLSITQTLDIYPYEGKLHDVLVTTLNHNSGESVTSNQLLKATKEDPQAQGSAISYARRYSLSAILGIVTDEDDDANTTVEKKVEKATVEKAEPKISEAQTKMIYATVKENGYTADHAKAYLKEFFNKASTKQLTSAEASKFIKDIEAGKLGGIVQEALKQGAEIID
jgi:hypothetical protein